MLKSVRQRKESVKGAKHSEIRWAVIRPCANGTNRAVVEFGEREDAEQYVRDRIDPKSCRICRVKIEEV
jgi:hypothetical protein